jgi:hypothetical protein
MARVLGVSSDTATLQLGFVLTVDSQHTVGWSGIIRVDGTAYTWMGNPGPASAEQLSFNYTSTRSIFKFNVGDAVDLTVTFLSPIFPNDLQKQSLVFSYLDVEVSAVDGKSHEVQIYSDISAGKLPEH